MAIPPVVSKIGSRFFGGIVGGITGFISGPFIGAWYTYQSSASRRFDARFAVSVASFLPRLLINVLSFPFLGLASGVYQGANLGIKAGLGWPFRTLSIINHPIQGRGLLERLFSVRRQRPPSVPIQAVPGSAPVIEEKKELKLTPSQLAFLNGTPYNGPKVDEEKEEKLAKPDDAFTLKCGSASIYQPGEFKTLLTKLKAPYTSVNLNHYSLDRLTPEQISELMQCINESQTEVLSLNFTGIGHWSSEQLEAFCRKLEKNKTINSLYLHDTHLDNFPPQHFNRLMAAIATTEIKVLDLGNNKLSTVSSETLFSYLSPLVGKIKALFLNQNNLGTWPRDVLTDFIAKMKIIQVDLSCNELQTKKWTEVDIEHFMKGIGGLASINLEHNLFNQAQIKVFERHTVEGMRDMRLMFLRGRISKNPVLIENKDKAQEHKVPAIYGRFFSNPMGQKAALELTKRIFSYVGVELHF